MRLLLISLAALLCAGCPKECKTNADCPGSLCQTFQTGDGKRRFCADSVAEYYKTDPKALGVKQVVVGTGGVEITVTPGGQ